MASIERTKVLKFLKALGNDPQAVVDFHADPTTYNNRLATDDRLNDDEMALVQDVDACRQYFGLNKNWCAGFNYGP